jgi:hypothetical protein
MYNCLHYHELNVHSTVELHFVSCVGMNKFVVTAVRKKADMTVSGVQFCVDFADHKMCIRLSPPDCPFCRMHLCDSCPGTGTKKVNIERYLPRIDQSSRQDNDHVTTNNTRYGHTHTEVVCGTGAWSPTQSLRLSDPASSSPSLFISGLFRSVPFCYNSLLYCLNAVTTFSYYNTLIFYIAETRRIL